MSTITLFLCGDVMTGRGIDQILRHPSDPVIYEPYIKDARGYVDLAERANGPIPRGVDPAYISLGRQLGVWHPRGEVEFAHRLIDDAGIDLVYGHSHHAKGIEVYQDKLILYGCVDFLNDYEGIEGYEGFRDDLGLMYFADVDPSTGRLLRLSMRPTTIRNFRVNLASAEDAGWMADTLNREGSRFGTGVKKEEDGMLTLLRGELSNNVCL